VTSASSALFRKQLCSPRLPCVFKARSAIYPKKFSWLSLDIPWRQCPRACFLNRRVLRPIFRKSEPPTRAGAIHASSLSSPIEKPPGLASHDELCGWPPLAFPPPHLSTVQQNTFDGEWLIPFPRSALSVLWYVLKLFPLHFKGGNLRPTVSGLAIPNPYLFPFSSIS